MTRPFLTARWSNLCLVTYAVPPEVLEHRLPPGLELDQRDGQGFVSLVAFDFLDTRVLGIRWPGYRHFPEINLRFYVRERQTGQRGVVFIREFVPLKLVAWMARGLYGEPYQAAPMSSRIVEDHRRIDVEHRLTFGGRENRLRAVGAKPCALPPEDGVEHFFKEHQWGFSRGRRGDRCIIYEVSHPHWRCYPVEHFELDFDFGAVYGEEFVMLNGVGPYSVILAEGSNVAVYPKASLERATTSTQVS